jgi:hypothetical protein
MPRARIKQAPGLKAEEPVLSEIEETVDVQAEEVLEVSFDPESKTASFVVNNIPVVIREPKGRDFLTLTDWIGTKAQLDDEPPGSLITTMKLLSLCIVRFGNKNRVSLDDLLDNLPTQKDVEVAASGLNFFSDQITAYYGTESSPDGDSAGEAVLP